MNILMDISLSVILVTLTIGVILLCAYLIYKAICYVISEKYNIDTWREYYDQQYEKRVKQIADEYKNKLESKSKEYFKEFYDETMKKKGEQNGNKI